MEEWYYTKSNEQRGPVSGEQIEQLIAEGEINETTQVWKEGMPDWEPATRFFSSNLASAPPAEQTAVCAISGQVLPVSEMLQYGDKYVSPAHKDEFLQNLREGGPLGPVSGDSLHTYADPIRRYAITRVFFIIGTVIEVIMAVASFYQSDPNDFDTFNTADAIISVLALGFLACYIAGIVFFCMWTHRVCRNSHAFGTEPGAYSPGWAVGYYFIPILTLFRPFQAMKQTWNATFQEPADSPAPPVMVQWWTLWIISNLLAQISMRAPQSSGFIADIISAVLAIPLLLVTLSMMKKLTYAQVERADGRVYPT